MSHHHEAPEPPTRRTFIDWALHGLGAIFAVVFGFPILCYAIDPRNRPKPPGDFRPVAGIKLSEVGAEPVQGTIRAVRWDSYTLYPNDVIGRVWVRRNEKGDLLVLSTKCPHLGCSINCNTDQAVNPGYTCPCHAGRFELNGDRIAPNPATRGMYVLDFEVAADPTNPNPDNRDLLLVKYVLPSNNAAAVEAKNG